MPTLRVRNATNTGWIDAAAGGFKVRNAANSGWLTDLSKVSVRNGANSGWLTFGSGGTTYSVTPSTSSVNEGSSVSFSVSVSGSFTGTLYWTNSGTTSGADFSDGQNSGSISVSGGTGSLTRTLSNDATTEGGETIVIQLRTGSTGGTVVATSSTVTVADTSTTPSAPTSLSLALNDLDFYFLPTETSASEGYNDVICALDATSYYSNGGDHIAFALDCNGAQGSNNPHCGPIYRNGGNLWANGRGFIIFGNGTVMAEQWNSTSSPGLTTISNTSGATFNPASTPTFTVRIKAGYRSGVWANTMTIEIREGSSFFGTVLFTGSIGWGWDWTGSHTVAIAGIAGGFVSPNSTGCSEVLVPRTAPSAVVGFSNFDLRLF